MSSKHSSVKQRQGGRVGVTSLLLKSWLSISWFNDDIEDDVLLFNFSMGEGEEGVQKRDSSILASVTSRNNIKWNSMQKCPIAFQSKVQYTVCVQYCM
jgi:hypothetical protein